MHGDFALTDGNHWLQQDLSTALRFVSSEPRVKNGYLGKVPVLLAEAEDKDIAQRCIHQLRTLPGDVSDPRLRWMRDVCIEPLQAFIRKLSPFGSECMERLSDA